jgi:hypothetical protein
MPIIKALKGRSIVSPPTFAGLRNPFLRPQGERFQPSPMGTLKKTNVLDFTDFTDQCNGLSEALQAGALFGFRRIWRVIFRFGQLDPDPMHTLAISIQYLNSEPP